MSIDMKNFMGGNDAPAATEQFEQNSYAREESEYGDPLPPIEGEEPLEQAPEQVQEEPTPPPQEDRQDHNFKALSESVERLKAEREAEKREYQLQLDMLRANLHKQQPYEAPKQKQMFEGMSDNEIPNVGELRQAWNERERAYSERIEELQVANQYPDYADILQKHGKHLAETDPIFIQGIRGAENKALFAYTYAKQAARLQELETQAQARSAPAPSPKVNNAQRIVDNARKPGTLAQTGGQSVLSKADYYETMSDADFMKMASKHMDSV